MPALWSALDVWQGSTWQQERMAGAFPLCCEWEQREVGGRAWGFNGSHPRDLSSS